MPIPYWAEDLERQDARGHVWERAPDGEISYQEPRDSHGAPVCERCGYTYCVHCHPDAVPEPCEVPRLRPQVTLVLGDWPAQPVPFHYYDPATGLEIRAEISEGGEVRGKASRRRGR